MNLHEDKIFFKEVITKTAEHFSLLEEFIEKDYWVTVILKNLVLSEYKNKFVFRGGTSLSKAYKCIERFSEDIDISPIEKSEIQNQNKKMLKNLEAASFHKLPLIKQKEESKKGSTIRTTPLNYPTVVESRSPQTILEVSTFIGLDKKDIESKKIQPYITEYLKTQGHHNFVKKYNIDSFPIQVQSQTLTLCEKIMCLLYMYETNKDFDRKDRHFYDISQLLKQDNVKEYTTSHLFLDDLSKIYLSEITWRDPYIPEGQFKLTKWHNDLDNILKSLKNNKFEDLLHKKNKNVFQEIESAFKHINNVLSNVSIDIEQ